MATRKMGSRTRKSARKSARRTRATGSAHRYGDKAAEKVERAMHEMKRGELFSGGSGKKVTDPKQAVAIGLSEARRAGGKVPPPPKARRSRKGARQRASST